MAGQDEKMSRAIKRASDLMRSNGRSLSASEIHAIYVTEGIPSPGVDVIAERMEFWTKQGVLRHAKE